ncbi:Peptidase A1 domain-containing protein [Aphelenchoides besseyi]|nr:Peptidase A1 domain-containing protein [Aphelenchoides besseyi]
MITSINRLSFLIMFFGFLLMVTDVLSKGAFKMKLTRRLNGRPASLSNQGNIQYRGIISLGSPGLRHRVEYSLVGCKSSGPYARSCKSGHMLYDPDASSTSKDQNQPFGISYGTGEAKGEYYSDVFAFGDPNGPQMKLKNPVVFGAGTDLSFTDEGILGLPAFSNLNEIGTSVLHQALDEGLMDKPYFTTHMKSCSGNCTDGGLITFVNTKTDNLMAIVGGEDKENCGPIEGWATLIADSQHWKFTVDASSMDGAVFRTPQSAITDTGTSIIVAPEKVVRVFAAVLGAQEYDGSYYVSCKKKFDFKLKIGGKIFTIPSEQLLMDNKDGYCELLLVSGDYGFWILGAGDPTGNDTLLVQHDVYRERMLSKRNIEYLGTVTLGNPPQAFQAILDTGSDIFWVPKVNCYSTGPYANNCRSGRSLYSPKRSKKSKRLGRPFSIHYGTGSASGGYYKDFGSPDGKQLKLKSRVVFGAATEMTFGDTAILGLPSTDTSSGRGYSIFHQAVRDGLMDKPIFTAYLRKCSQGGQITFGSEDKANCQKVKRWVDVDPGVPHWRFSMQSISVNGYRKRGPMKVISDTGTSDIVVPTEVANRIGRAIGAVNRGGGRYVRCGKEFNVKLRIKGHSYLLPSKQLLLPAGNGYCRLGISGGAEQLGVWILGDPFLRSFCNVHDIKRRRIGFAKLK